MLAGRAPATLARSYEKRVWPHGFTDEAKMMCRWIEWIVLADLPLYVVENEHYRKNSSLKPTTYKTISKHMTSLLEIVKLNIKKGSPNHSGSYSMVTDV
jgi:hypothetical protein